MFFLDITISSRLMIILSICSSRILCGMTQNKVTLNMFLIMKEVDSEADVLLIVFDTNGALCHRGMYQTLAPLAAGSIFT